DYDLSVEFYWSPFLVQLDKYQANGTKILRLDQLEASSMHWQGADIMVFNTGHWWVHRGKLRAWDMFHYEGKLVEEMKIESALDMAMKAWAYWIDNNVDSTKTTVFFRSISPEHKGKHWCYNETKPITDESHEESFPRPLMDIVERTIRGMRMPVRFLNITKLSQYRRDAHTSIFRTRAGKELIEKKQKQAKSFADCSHWCLPGLPDTWNRLMYADMILHSSKICAGLPHVVV
ncbi:unnamed protein product, partial [Ilex paraguariensis]